MLPFDKVLILANLHKFLPEPAHLPPTWRTESILTVVSLHACCFWIRFVSFTSTLGTYSIDAAVSRHCNAVTTIHIHRILLQSTGSSQWTGFEPIISIRLSSTLIVFYFYKIFSWIQKWNRRNYEKYKSPNVHCQQWMLMKCLINQSHILLPYF